MPAIKTPKATIQPQRGLRLSIALRKFSGGSGNGPVLTEYAINLILALSFSQPGISLVPPAPFFPADIFSVFGALFAFCGVFGRRSKALRFPARGDIVRGIF
jgi:hypothetical protein